MPQGAEASANGLDRGATDGRLEPVVPPPPGPVSPALVALDAPPAVRDIRDATVVKDGDVFLLADLEGNVPRGNSNGLGLYLRDTRYLSSYELVLANVRPMVLLPSAPSHLYGVQVLTNPSLATSDGQVVHDHTLQIRRYRVLRGTRLDESITIQNFNRFPLTLDVALRFDADFADMFEVRGIVVRDGDAPRSVSSDAGSLRFAATGRDGVTRATEVRFDPPPREIVDGVARYDLALAAGGTERVAITIRVDESLPGSAAPAVSPRATVGGPRAWVGPLPRIETSNGLFNHVLAQARADLVALLSVEGGTPFVAAGVPWYATLFGRDSLLTALSDLWLSPALARDTLRLLARLQGQRDSPANDEEPGKIPHELRRGELVRCGLVPFGPYYGTVDATPLWIVLLGEYERATADLGLVRELRPNLEAALAWIDVWGDRDGDGFVEYRSRSGAGLVNQGWKDSWDGIVHSDGSLPVGPIALVEVQGYVFAAKRAAARLFRLLGEPSRAAELDSAAERLRAAFDAAFWMPDESTYALALDGNHRPLEVVTSNPGHALWSGIVPDERAPHVARRLLGEDLFSGWGVRTLSNREVAYNPVGYHLGTVWPHDNAIVALGLKRCGQEALAVELVSALYDATQYFPQFRTPELFCGFARSAFGVPVRYPVACSPQAWAAASWSALLQVILGVQPHAPSGELRIVRPALPPWLREVRIQGLAVGEGEVDLRYERVGDHSAVDVEAMRGPVRVAFVERWSDDE